MENLEILDDIYNGIRKLNTDNQSVTEILPVVKRLEPAVAKLAQDVKQLRESPPAQNLNLNPNFVANINKIATEITSQSTNNQDVAIEIKELRDIFFKFTMGSILIIVFLGFVLIYLFRQVEITDKKLDAITKTLENSAQKTPILGPKKKSKR